MAVLPMKKIEICAMKRDRKAILEKLQSLGMVEIQTDTEETDDFSRQKQLRPRPWPLPAPRRSGRSRCSPS